jgi:hypothetical protein
VPVGAVTSARVVALNSVVLVPIVSVAFTAVLAVAAVVRRITRVCVPAIRVVGAFVKLPPLSEYSALASPLRVKSPWALVPLRVKLAEDTTTPGAWLVSGAGAVNTNPLELEDELELEEVLRDLPPEPQAVRLKLAIRQDKSRTREVLGDVINMTMGILYKGRFMGYSTKGQHYGRGGAGFVHASERKGVD